MRHLGVRGGASNRVVVRINDRGPFVRGRVIDLSTAAMKSLGGGGDLLPVCVDVVLG
jgi:rare lipoprotein A